MTISERAKGLAESLRRDAGQHATISEIEVAVLAALKEQDKITRHACAEAVTKLSASVAEGNARNGHAAGQASEFACGILDRAAAIIINLEGK